MSFLLIAAGSAASKSLGTGAAKFVIFPAIILGLVIAFVELVFVHQDERGMGWLAHGLHAVPVTMVFTFITMNVPYVMSFFTNIKYASWMEPAVIIVVGIIAMAKVLTAAAIAGRVGEKKFHVFIIGGLIILAPYAWKLVLNPMLCGGLIPLAWC